ncbi:MAG: hypothetical protein JWP97_2488 [Labilithrix sp.]|nr:hypothetical protein [Labilithrix sp.]
MLKKFLTPTNIIIGGLVLATMLYLAFDFVRTNYFGSEIGEACKTSSDCKGGGNTWCLEKADKSGRYCSTACAGNGNCPAKWSCGDSGYTKQMQYKSGATGMKTAVNVCYMDQKIPMSH